MSARTVSTEGTAKLSPTMDARLVPFSLLALGGLAGSLVAGQPALAALAVPFALALALGLRRTGAIEVRARVTIEADQVLEGDLVMGTLELDWPGTFDADVLVHRLKGVTPIPVLASLQDGAHRRSSRRESNLELASETQPVAAGAGPWALPAATDSVVLPIRLQATQWGRHVVGEIWVRLEAPLGLLSWTGKVATCPALRVLPGSERLTRLLDPTEARAVLGTHRSVRIGDGHEFAELRHYTPGDRLRDLNWRATARHRRPFVNRRHPERSGDVVIALDAFADGSAGSAEALARAARAGWALASIHLQANDRVGLAGLGGSTQWLSPAGGRLAQYKLLETLLRIGGEVTDRAVFKAVHSRLPIPPAALVIALTPLHDVATLATLEAWRARGRAVAVVMIDACASLDDPTAVSESLARRLWALEINRRKRELTQLGIPVVTVAGDGPITPVVSALRRARRAPSVRRGR